MLARDKVNLDIFWVKDHALDDPDLLPPPDEVAAEIVDAFTVGLTATPSLHTLGFFGKNLVAQYPYERSVVDGVNVGFEIFRIRTEIDERGATVKAGYDLPVRDKRTRALKLRCAQAGGSP